MQNDVIRRIKERRDGVHRRINELRSEIEILEARADELERIWKEVRATEPQLLASGVTYIGEPRVATATPSGTVGLVLRAMSELEEAGYEGADRASIVAIVLREAPKTKPNTIRVAFKRLLRRGRIQKYGNLYNLPNGEATATNAGTALAAGR